jgi:MFS family permease
MHVMYLVTYVVFGIVLAVLALALYQRLKSEAPVLMQAATAVGLLWAFVLVASGMVFNAGMAAAVELYPTDPGQAVSLWQAIEPVAQGLGGSGGEILGGLWVLLVSVAGLRGRAFPRPLAWLGVAVGVAGLLSVVPPLNDVGMVFGLLQIVWFVGLGIAMLRTAQPAGQALAPEAEPA